LDLVLDSNEYIFAFGNIKKPYCEQLIKLVENKYPMHIIHIPQLIIEEVRNNLNIKAFREFILFINSLTTIDENILVPFELGTKYEAKKFKPADAFISAYTEWCGAKILVTENRHFLSCQLVLPFKILTAERCLLELK